MEHFTVKQECGEEEDMDIGSEFINEDYVGIGQVSGVPVEIDLMKGRIDDKHNYAEVPSSSGQTNEVKLITLSNNLQSGEQQIAMQNNQIIMTTSNSGQSLLANKNQTVNNSQNQGITKLVIQKSATERQHNVLSVGPQGLQQVGTVARNSVGQNLIGQPAVVTTLSNAFENSVGVTQGLLGHPAMLTTSLPVSSPTKTIVLSPQKHLTTSNKYTVTTSKLPVSPSKTPPKRTVIPLSPLHKSPQKFAQVPGGHQYVMLTRPPSTTTPKVNTITLSPPKVIIKGQTPVSVATIQQVPYPTSQNQSLVQSSQQNNVNLSNVPSNVQPLSVSGSKFQYVRLVAAPATQKQTNQVSRPPTIAPAPQRGVTPASNPAPVKVAVPLNSSQTIHPKQSNQSQRLILPATSQVSLGAQGLQPTIQANTSTLLTSGTNAAQTINLQGLPGFTVIPAQYILQQQNQTQALQAKQEPYQTAQQNAGPKHNTNGNVAPESLVQRPRKPCNCTKSQCLKLYCDCFANGEFCSNCNCSNCYNNLDHEEERQRAIKTCLERNPHAFHPKIGKGRGGTGDRRHNKGCNCKRSGCLKNYCECYEAKIMCSSLCKCVGCKNYEESSDRKTLMHLADAAEVRHQQQTAVKTKLSTQIQELAPRHHPPTAGERLPYTFVTAEVAEATCACLVAQAEEAERTRQQEMMEEQMILQEFGRCLMQVIQSATSTKAPSPVP